MGEERGKKSNRQRYFVFFVFFVFFFSAAFNLYRLKDILLYIEFLPIEYHSTQIMESYNFIFIFVGKEIFSTSTRALSEISLVSLVVAGTS